MSKEVLSLRASALPRAMLCPGSVRGELRIDTTDEAGRLGSAAHNLLADLVRIGRIDWDAVPVVAAKFDVDADDLESLCRSGAWCWERFTASNPIPDDFGEEVPLSATFGSVLLTGHADAVLVYERRAILPDWKSGRKDTNYEWQMKGYCALALRSDDRFDSATATLIWLRERETESYTMRREDLPAFEAELHRIVEWDGVYHPGEHCHYCPRRHECQARHAMARADVLAMDDRNLVYSAESELALMAPDAIVQLHAKAARVEDYAQRVKGAIRDHVLGLGGTLEGAAHKLTIEETHPRTVDPMKAWPVLESAGFESEDFAACMKLGVTKLEKRVSQRAGKGNGAGAVRQLAKELAAAGAIEVETVRKLVVKRR